MPDCKRCSECAGQDHHWCTEILTDDGERLQCKHCDATCVECDACEDGTTYVVDGDGEEHASECVECEGGGYVDFQEERLCERQ
jgi:hypothetical protein